MTPELLADEIAEKLYRLPDAHERVEELKDRLAAERQRRLEFYDWLDGDKKAEFIDGEIVLHSPVVKRHLDATKWILMLVNTFVEVHEIGWVASEKLLVRLQRNDFEPEVVFFNADKEADFTDGQLLFPAPDLAVEVLSPGTEDNDRTTKYRDYAANGVREYWIVDARRQSIERHVLRDDATYELVEHLTEASSPLRCSVIPNFEFPLMAAFDRRTNIKAIFSMRPAE